MLTGSASNNSRFTLGLQGIIAAKKLICKNQTPTPEKHSLIEPIVGRSLVDIQPHFIKPRHFQVLLTDVPLHVVVGEVGQDLLQHNVVVISRVVSREVVAVNGDLLVGRGLATLHVEAGQI